MRKSSPAAITLLALASLCAAATPPIAVTRPAAEPPSIRTPRYWFTAAMEHAALLDEPPPGTISAPYGPRLSTMIYILQTQVETGDAEAAAALALRHAPQLLGAVASAQASRSSGGDARGARLTLSRISDPKERQQALYDVVYGLIWTGKLADAAAILKDRPGDELTANLYENLATAQAKAGDIAGTQASITALAAAPEGDGLNNVRLGGAHVALAAAFLRAGNRPAYEQNLATARQLSKTLRSPYDRNVMIQIIKAQAAAGDYEEATATFNALSPEDRSGTPDLILMEKIRRGDITPAAALAQVPDTSQVYEVVIDVQLAANDPKAAGETLKRYKQRYYGMFDFHQRLLDGFIATSGVAGAAEFIDGLSDPGMRAEFYTYLARTRAAAGDRANYQALDAKALASALLIVNPNFEGAQAVVRSEHVFNILARVQMTAGDFAGAAKTIAAIADAAQRRPMKLELQARQFAAEDKLEEARTWVATLPDPKDRAYACRNVALELATRKNPPAP